MKKEKILIIIVSRIGDTMFVTPSIRAIADAKPNATIDVLAHPNRYEVLQNLPFINKVGKITKNSAWLKSIVSLKKYDYAIVYGFDKPLVKYALKVANKVVAFTQDNDKLNAKLYRAVTPPPFQSEHAVYQLLRLPAELGAKTQNFRLAYAPTNSELEWAKDRLKLLSRPIIGLQIASFHTMAFRDWPVERFFELCNMILQDYPNAKFLILGGKEEKDRTSALAKALGDSALDLAGTMSLRQSAAIMGELDLYIGVDTGPTHIMSSFNIPMVAMYHANSPKEHTGPIGHPKARLINHPKGHFNDPDISMDEISAQTVYEEALKALKGEF